VKLYTMLVMVFMFGRSGDLPCRAPRHDVDCIASFYRDLCLFERHCEKARWTVPRFMHRMVTAALLAGTLHVFPFYA
jgi:hypothetical protein